ncbi:MAG: glycosyltransferase family 87 protein [Alphaproteobacteria bacterium]
MQALPSQPETRRMLRFTGGFCFLFLALAWMASWHWQGGWLYEGVGTCDLVVGRDFFQFWQMGRAAWQPDPGRFYDFGHYLSALHGQLGAGYCEQQWSYPPSLLLFAAPFGTLPYLPALLLWSLAGPLVLMHFARRDDGLDAALVLLSPAAFFCLISGQNSFFTLALIYGGFTLRRQKPALAGVLFGLLSLKPQLALLLPVLLIAERNWRALGIAALTALALVVAVWAAFGWDAWADYLTLGLPEQHDILARPPRNIMACMVTLFMDLRAAGTGYGAAMALQGLLALAMAVATYRFFRARRDETWSFLFFAAASLLATPYAMGYDLLGLTLAIALVLARHRLNPTQQSLLVAGFFLPLLHYAAISFHLPGTALLPLPIAWLAWRKGREMAER